MGPTASLLYGDEEKVREICKRLDQYHDPAIHLAGVALTNKRSKGVVWNQQIRRLESLEADAAAWVAVQDDADQVKQQLQKLGFTQFLALPDYIKGIGNV